MKYVLLYAAIWIIAVIVIVFYSNHCEAAIYLCNEVKSKNDKFFICEVAYPEHRKYKTHHQVIDQKSN